MAGPRRDPKTGKFVKRNAKRGKRRANKTTVRRKTRGLKGHKPGCRCVIHARRRNPRTRGFYATRKDQTRGAASFKLTPEATEMWRGRDMEFRNKVLAAAHRESFRERGKTVVIKAADGKELERYRAGNHYLGAGSSMRNPRTRRNAQRYGSVRSGVTSREAQKYSTAGRQIGAEVWLNAQETRLLKSHGIAGQAISDDALETAKATAREIGQHVAIVFHNGSVYKIINPSGAVLFGPYR